MLMVFTDCTDFSDDATSWTLPQPNFTNCTPLRFLITPNSSYPYYLVGVFSFLNSSLEQICWHKHRLLKIVKGEKNVDSCQIVCQVFNYIRGSFFANYIS